MDKISEERNELAFFGKFREIGHQVSRRLAFFLDTTAKLQPAHHERKYQREVVTRSGTLPMCSPLTLSILETMCRMKHVRDAKQPKKAVCCSPRKSSLSA